mmetsp:Transcript_24596/g.53696  ORF Transcript_24596/g.53696 Transcript_24596/m.53696 type:complete len:233 (+) Transcript_24596:599-1297(+)
MVRLLGDEVVERQPPLALAKLARAVLHLLLRVIHRCRDGDDLRRGRALQLGPLAEAHDEHPGQRRGHLLDRRLVPFSVFLKHGEHRLTSLQWLRRRRLPVENAALRQTRDQLLDVFLLAGFVKLTSTDNSSRRQKYGLLFSSSRHLLPVKEALFSSLREGLASSARRSIPRSSQRSSWTSSHQPSMQSGCRAAPYSIRLAAMESRISAGTAGISALIAARTVVCCAICCFSP